MMEVSFIFAAISACVAVVGAIAAALRHQHIQIRAVQQDAVHEIDAIREQLAATRRHLNDFQVEVAKNYTTNSVIQQVEDRLVAAINRIGDRLDQAFDKLASRQ